MTGHELTYDKEQESDHADDAQRKNEMRREPVIFLAFIEHDLERANAQREIADAPVVNAAFSALNVWRIVNEHGGHDHGNYSDRDVDIEEPAPAITVSN